MLPDTLEQLNWYYVRAWLIALTILTTFSLLAWALPRFILRPGEKRGFSSAKELLSQFHVPLSGSLVFLGLKLFLEVAPLNPRVLAWVDGSTYLFGVVLLVIVIRKSAFIALEWSLRASAPSLELQQGFVPLFKNIITLFTLTSGCITALKHFNYDVMSLLTALGVGSLAVGLASKETLSHMISGFTLIIDRNMKPGDRINLAGVIGDVDEIGLRSTRIRMGDGNLLIVPNSELVNTKILNLSMPTPEVACSSVLRFPIQVEFSQIKAVCLETLERIPSVNASKSRGVTLTSLAEGVQQISVSFWVTHPDQAGTALSEFHDQLLRKLPTVGIRLAEPLRPA